MAVLSLGVSLTKDGVHSTERSLQKHSLISNIHNMMYWVNNQSSLVSTFREINKVSYEKCLDQHKLVLQLVRWTGNRNSLLNPPYMCRGASQAPSRRCVAYLVWSFGWICWYVSAVNPRSFQNTYFAPETYQQIHPNDTERLDGDWLAPRHMQGKKRDKLWVSWTSL